MQVLACAGIEYLGGKIVSSDIGVGFLHGFVLCMFMWDVIVVVDGYGIVMDCLRLDTSQYYTAAKNYIIITVFNVGENEGVRAPNFK